MSPHVEMVERGDRLIVCAAFNHRWKAWAHENGGKWDPGSMAWTFPLEQREAVEAAIEMIFEEDDA